MRIYRCIQSNYLIQGFGENNACGKIISNGKIDVLGKTNGVCPSGYYSLYDRLLGMRGHNGLDFASFYKEPGYFDTETDCQWNQYIEIDSNGGLGIDVVSSVPVLPCTEGCPEGTMHHIKRRYWHNISAVINGAEWSYEQCRAFIGGQERRLAKENVRFGERIFLADSTGISSGNHVHDSTKWCNANGDGLHTNNGYNGAFDDGTFRVNKFVLDVLVDRKMEEIKKMEEQQNSYGANRLKNELEMEIFSRQLTLVQLIAKWVFILQGKIRQLKEKVGSILNN